MIFEKDKYYKYIGTLEKIVNAIYIIYIIIACLIGIATSSAMATIIILLISVLLATLQTLVFKIKIQEMKWKMDIHDIMKQNKNNT